MGINLNFCEEIALLSHCGKLFKRLEKQMKSHFIKSVDIKECNSLTKLDSVVQFQLQTVVTYNKF